MNLKLIYQIIVLYLLGASQVCGQNKYPITFGYYGETITHPGFYVGSESLLNSKFILELGIGTYLHYKHHRGVFVRGNVNWRKTFDSGYSMQYGLGIGYLHTWVHGGKTYEVDNSGIVNSRNNNGRSALMPIIKMGVLGWDFRKRTTAPIRIFADIEIFGQYPHNNFIMPHFALNLGGTYYSKK